MQVGPFSSKVTGLFRIKFENIVIEVLLKIFS